MPFDDLPDEQLIALLKDREQEALGQLYDRHGRAVFSFAFHVLADHAKAEEVTQDVFMNAWLKAATFRPERGAARTWLMTIAHHRAVDELRRDRRYQGVINEAVQYASRDTSTGSGNPATEAQREEEGAAVRKALQSLPPDQRQVTELAYYQGLTQAEIAQRLQQPLGTVKTRMRLAMQKLRAALASYVELK